MEIIFIGDLAFKPEIVSKQLHTPDLELVKQLVAKISAVLEPKAAFEVGYVDEKKDDGVVINGFRFHSRVLHHNLNGIGRVFPFVLTLGSAVDELIENAEDLLEKYLLDQLGNIALNQTRQKFEDHLRKHFALDNISCMSPGSLADWPIEEQKNLFLLLGLVKSTVGVRLTDSFLMLPRKSVSGIYFPAEVSFYSCQLCKRAHCDSRKAKYDEKKGRSYGLVK